jgi:hypothetical protein
MFKYNNQDHAMATGLLAARTLLGVSKYDPWMVKQVRQFGDIHRNPSRLVSFQ